VHAALLAEDVLTVGSPYHPAKQRLAFGLASSGGWVGAGDMAGDGLGAGPGVALEAGASAKSALPLGVAAVGAVGVGAGELAQGETAGGFRRSELGVDGHR
jgi:hypothetical protein